MISPKNEDEKGYISAVNGSLIEVKGIEKLIKLHDLVKIVKHNILGEVIQISADHVLVQCYEQTNNLKLREEVLSLQEPLSMELAPGLLGNIFDGIQRPLDQIYHILQGTGYLKRGIELPSLSREKIWHFVPLKELGESIDEGDIVGTVMETPSIEHKIMVPIGVAGKLSYIVEEGDFHINDEIFRVRMENEEKSFNMIQKWAVSKKRSYISRILPEEPLITGIRIIDLLFPIVKGGTVAVPGGFGTGKTVIQQSLAKWCNADIIVFVGCGERGNEIADVLHEFAKITDPKSGRPLLERIILIANTSNMPVSAREASIFTGVTIAEYYRDMGYDVAVLADSTSRWAESLREISGLAEEMPAEEGYPAYLPSKLSSFYERAGQVNVLGNRSGSLTIIGSISPPSGDFSEPVTATTKRFVQAFWALDANLAYSKHYPAINWLESYSNYPEYISEWWFERDVDLPELDIDWFQCRHQVNEILSKEFELMNIVQLVGEENLPEDQQLTLFMGRMLRESFLIQNAFDPIDNFTDMNKLITHIKTLLLFQKEANTLLQEGIIIDDIKSLKIIEELQRISRTIPNNEYFQILNLKNQMIREIDLLKLMYGTKKS